MDLWLYLDFPSLQLDTLFTEEVVTPVIILNDNGVYQYNASAREQGIKKGMGLGAAAALCNPLSVHKYSPNLEQKKLKEIAQWLYIKTSDISFFEPNGILLRVTNMLTLYHDLTSYWQTLAQHLNTLNVNYNFATGNSPFAARLLAKNAVNIISDDQKKLLSLIKSHSIAATDLPYKTIEKLTRVGIHKIKDLLVISMADIAQRFDIELVTYVGKLLGQFKHPIDFYHPPETFQRYLELLFELEKIDWVNKPLHKLLAQLTPFLKLRNQLAHELVLTLHQRDSENYELTVTSAQGEYQAEKWLALFQLALSSVTLTSPVQGLTLTANRIVAQSCSEDDFFDQKHGASTALELVSTLQAKLGKSAVLGSCATEDARPEFSSSFCAPLTPSLKMATNEHLVRPTFLFATPQPLKDKVHVIQGPERIATGWWDNHTLIRDYFIARDSINRWLWVFRDHQKNWYIHGVFS